jgi:hypothetical protein
MNLHWKPVHTLCSWSGYSPSLIFCMFKNEWYRYENHLPCFGYVVFICNGFNTVVSNSDYIASINWVTVNKELQRICMQTVMA